MRTVYWVINFCLIIALICFLFAVWYFINGSLEPFPTAEQQGKAKPAAVFLCFGEGFMLIRSGSRCLPFLSLLEQ